MSVAGPIARWFLAVVAVGALVAMAVEGHVLTRESEKQTCLARVNAEAQGLAAASPQRFGSADSHRVMEAIRELVKLCPTKP
jgi:hypothetical protein